MILYLNSLKFELLLLFVKYSRHESVCVSLCISPVSQIGYYDVV